MSQDPWTDTPWGTDVDETPENVTAGLRGKRTRKPVEYSRVGNCPKLQAFQEKQYLEMQCWVGSLGAAPGMRLCEGVS